MIISNYKGSLQEKKSDAEERIGKHLLLLIVSKKSLIIGRKFDQRRNKPAEGISLINPQVLVAGIGDLRDYIAVKTEIADFSKNIAYLLGAHYITGAGIVKRLSSYLQNRYEEKATARAVNFIISDWGKDEGPNLWFIDFDGRIKELKNFAVAGGLAYKKILTAKDAEEIKKEIETCEKEGKELAENQKENSKNIDDIKDNPEEWRLTINPRKTAIALLDTHWKKNMKIEEAVNLVKMTLLLCDSFKKDQIFEITTFADGKEPVANYFKEDFIKT